MRAEFKPSTGVMSRFQAEFRYSECSAAYPTQQELTMTRISTTAALSALVIAGGLGCDGEPLTPGSSGRSHGSAASSAVGVDTDAIQELVDAQFAAWHAKDATAFAATYTVDAAFYDPIGNVFEGREAIQAAHAFLYGGPFGPSSETQIITSIRPLTGTIAVVHLRAALRDYVEPLVGLNPTEPGVLRTTKTWVVVKRAGSWLIHTQHMAPIAPAP